MECNGSPMAPFLPLFGSFTRQNGAGPVRVCLTYLGQVLRPIRDIQKVRKRQHQYPQFGHTQGD